MVQWAKNQPATQGTQEMWTQSLGGEGPLEKEMATHSSILAWRIPWMEEPGELQSTRSLSWTRLSIHVFTIVPTIHHVLGMYS